MIVSFDKVGVDGSISYDVIVVGAGAVGILCATDLADRGLKVIMLEAGPEWIDKDSQRFFEMALNAGRPHEGVHFGRYRALGGTTNFWGGQLVRFDPVVFEERHWLPDNAGWPLRRGDIEPYYQRCEDILRVPQMFRDEHHLPELVGIPVDRDDDNLKYFFSCWLTEKNFRTRFEQQLRYNKNLTVVTDAPVVGLRSSGNVARVDGVRIRNRGGKVADVDAKCIVLASGTVEVSRLLLHPLADGRDPPWGGNPWLGSCFMDHLEGCLGALKPRNTKLFQKMFSNLYIKGIKLQPRLKLTDDGQRSEQLLGYGLHVKIESSNKEHLENVKIFLNGLLRGRLFGSPSALVGNIWSIIRVGIPMAWHYIVSRRIFMPRNAKIGLQIVLEQQNTKESQIVLTQDMDYLGMRIVSLKWFVVGDREARTVASAAKHARRYFESKGIADFTSVEDLEIPKFVENMRDTYHQMGGARMAASSDQGVVDSTSKVFGVENLFVVGAAVFPSSGFANPTFTAMALALKSADAIAAVCGRS